MGPPPQAQESSGCAGQSLQPSRKSHGSVGSAHRWAPPRDRRRGGLTLLPSRRARAPPAAPPRTACIVRRRVAPVAHDVAMAAKIRRSIRVLLLCRRAHAPDVRKSAQAGRAGSVIAAQAIRSRGSSFKEYPSQPIPSST